MNLEHVSSPGCRTDEEVNAKKNRFSNRSLALSLLSVLLPLGGCGYSGYPLDGTTPTQPATPSEIGNWQITATSTAGTSPFSALAGWIYEPKGSTATASVTATSVFQATPDKSACYAAATTLPSEGTFAVTQLALNGFAVNGQYVTINATQDAAATHLTGTYSVRGGCAGGAAGSIDGTRYDALTGTYSGALTGGTTLTLTTTQDGFPNGVGEFPLSGTASGTSCLATAKIDAATSYVIGKTVAINLVDANGVRLLLLTGTFTSDASAITINSVTAGTCSDTSGTGTLQRGR